MYTALWLDVPEDIKNVLKIERSNNYTIEMKDQMDAYYHGRIFKYDNDTVKIKFHTILEDHLWIIEAIKTYKTAIVALANWFNYAQVEKGIHLTESGTLNFGVGSGTSTNTNKGTSFSAGTGKTNSVNTNNNRVGNTDANSELTETEDDKKKQVELLDPAKSVYAPMRMYSSGNTQNSGNMDDITAQANSLVNEVTAITSSKSTSFNKDTGKSDDFTVKFRKADNLMKIMNMKIPQLRKMLLNAWQPLYLSVYPTQYDILWQL